MPAKRLDGKELAKTMRAEVAAKVAARIKDYLERAAPACGGYEGDDRTFVLYPDSEAGRAYATDVRAVLPAAVTIPVGGAATDLLFCREHACLRPEEVVALVGNCLPAYYAALASPQTNPHARFDVNEWMPLSE